MSIKKKSITANAVFNILKTCASIVFPLITYPYVARILAVDDMGKIEFARSIINYVGLVAGLGISTYAIREGAKVRDDRERLEKLACQLFSINVIMTVFSLMLLSVLYFCIDFLHEYKELLFIFSFITIGTTVTSDWINSIYEDFGYITVRNVFIQFVALILILVFVRSPEDYLIYAGILTFSSAGSAIPNWLYIRKYCRLRLVRDCDIRRHIKPVLLIFAINVATVIYVNVDSTMLNVICGEYANGIYSAAVKVYNIFKNLVAAIIIVTVPRLSQMNGKGDIDNSRKLMKMIFNVVFILVMPLCLLCGLLSKEIILFVGGDKYELAELPLRILSISLLFSSMASFMTTSVLLPNGKERYILRASVVSAVVNFVLNFWMISYFSYVGAAITTMIAEAIMFFISCFAAKEHFALKEVRTVIIKCIISSSGIVLIWWLLGMTQIEGIIKIMVVGCTGMIIYGIINLLLWDIKLKDILGIIRSGRIE